MSSEDVNSNSSSLDHDDFVVVQPAETDDNMEGDDEGLETTPEDDASSEHDDQQITDHNASQKGAAIQFLNVQRVYPTDKDIRIRCVIVHPFKHSEMDSIGIYRVGWTDPSQASAIEYVQSVQRVDQLYTTLKSCFLPTNPTYDEYYQFCYICQDGKTVKGTSQPFHLIRSIKSSGPAVLQHAARPNSLITKETLGRSMVEVLKPVKVETPEPCGKCTELNSFKNRLEAAQQSKALAASELLALQERYEHLNNVFQVQVIEGRELKKQHDALELQKKEQEETISEIVDDISNRREELEKTKEKCKELIAEKDSFMSEINTLRNERETLVADNTRLTEQVATFTEELDEQKTQVSDKENWISSLRSEVERLENLTKDLTSERDQLNQSVVELTGQRDDLCKLVSDIEEARADTEQKTELVVQLQAISEERDKVAAEAIVMKDDREKLAADNEELQERVLVLSEEVNNQLEFVADRDSRITSLNEELSRMEESHKRVSNERNVLKATVLEVAAERDNLLAELSSMRLVREVAYRAEISADKIGEAHCQPPVKSTVELNAETKLAEEFHDVREMINSMADEKGETVLETLEYIKNYKEELERLVFTLQQQIEQDDEKNDKYFSKLEAKYRKVQHANDCLRSAHASGNKRDIKDVDVLLRFLPGLTQQLLNLSHANPDVQATINELRDMIRFLLTAHEQMKREITSLRQKNGPE